MGSAGRLSKHDPVWQRIRELHAKRFGPDSRCLCGYMLPVGRRLFVVVGLVAVLAAVPASALAARSCASIKAANSRLQVLILAGTSHALKHAVR